MDIFNSDHKSRAAEAEMKIPGVGAAAVEQPNQEEDSRPIKTETEQEKGPRPVKTGTNTAAAENVKEYQAYKASVKSYAADLKQEAELQKKIRRAKQQQSAYEQVWQMAGQNAQKAWQSSQNAEQLDAQRQRDALRRKAQTEKQTRIREAEQAEAKFKEAMNELEKAGKNAAAKEAVCQKKLKDSENYVVEGFDCDPRAERIIKNGVECQYLSSKQKQLAAQAPEEFCKKWASTPEELKNLEEKLLHTGLFSLLSQAESNEQAYTPLTTAAGGIAGVVMFLILTLNSLLRNGFFNALGKAAVFFGMALVWYVIAAGVAKFIKRHKDVKVHNSASGIIACVLAFLSAAPTAGSAYMHSAVLYSLGSRLFMSCLGGIMIAILLSQSAIHRLMVKIPAVFRLVNQNIYRNAGQNENRRRSKTNEVPLQNGEMDAMIACYANHEALLRYLSQNARDRYVLAVNNELQQAQALSGKIAKNKAELQDKQKDIQKLRGEAERKNRETDTKLAADLNEIDRRYGKSAAPDFRQRANLLAEDKNRLAVMEKQIGIRESDAGDSESAARACESVFALVYERMERVQSSIKENIRVIRDWYNGGSRPPFASGDGGYYYQLEPYLCIINVMDSLDERPVVIEHGNNPINLVYTNGAWDDENAAVLIKELWKGFTRIAPPELINFSIVDDTMRVGYSIGDSFKLSEFNKYYQNGFDTDVNQPSADSKMIPVRGLYDRRNIEKMDQDLNRKISDIQAYISKNASEISEACNVTRSEENITLVNYCMSHGTMHNAQPYHIVVFVVPEADEKNTFDSECIRSMRRLIEQKNSARKNGFIPIVLSAESSVNDKWLPIVNQTREKGVTCKVDLSTLKITM